MEIMASTIEEEKKKNEEIYKEYKMLLSQGSGTESRKEKELEEIVNVMSV